MRATARFSVVFASLLWAASAAATDGPQAHGLPRIDAVDVVGGQPLGDGRVKVSLRLFGPSPAGDDQIVVNHTVVVAAGTELRLGALGGRGGGSVSIRADRLGRVHTRYFEAASNASMILGGSFGVEIEAQRDGSALQLKGHLWPIHGAGRLSLRAADARQFKVSGESLVLSGSGFARTLKDAYRSVSGRRVMASGLDFVQNVAPAAPRVVTVGHFFNGLGQRVRLDVHVANQRISGLSQIVLPARR